MAEHSTNCRSADGIATGLIDGIIASLRVLHRHYPNADISEALKDLADDEDFNWLLEKMEATERHIEWATIKRLHGGRLECEEVKTIK